MQHSPPRWDLGLHPLETNDLLMKLQKNIDIAAMYFVCSLPVHGAPLLAFDGLYEQVPQEEE